VITHLCRTCGSPVEVARIDATTYISGPSFAWGRWDPCTSCGSTNQPMQVVEPNDPALGLGQWEPERKADEA
jgi:hypothetical protein